VARGLNYLGPMLPEERELAVTGIPSDRPAAPTEASPPTEVPDRAQLTRAMRDLEAAQARVERDARRVHDQTRSQLIGQLLPVLDNLDRTIASARHHGDAPAVLEGVRLVRSQLEGVLRGYGVERIDARGAAFDPALHDAISVVPAIDPRDHNRVIDQIEPGYRFNDQLLRPAKVVVGRRQGPPAGYGFPGWH
jgi:molecular chaperone GrpE